jgi:hypothetical protein
MAMRINPASLPVTIAIFLALGVLGGSSPKSAMAAASRRQISPLVARKQIQAIYDKEDVAADHKDIHGVFADMAPDFSAIDENGQKMSLSEIKAELADLFARATMVKGTTTIQKFRLAGRIATVTAKSRDEMTVTDPQTGHSRTVTIDDLSVDTWVRSGKAWLQTRSHDVSESIHTDTPDPEPSYDPLLS